MPPQELALDAIEDVVGWVSKQHRFGELKDNARNLLCGLKEKGYVVNFIFALELCPETRAESKTVRVHLHIWVSLRLPILAAALEFRGSHAWFNHQAASHFGGGQSRSIFAG
mmetsp:Transcript_66051/g.214857  ORF Transcript_66051/g.214857 Transcript_66051/m.214857 type:complete len:112 (+) Transcript_66051:2358-2693(+)